MKKSTVVNFNIITLGITATVETGQSGRNLGVAVIVNFQDGVTLTMFYCIY